MGTKKGRFEAVGLPLTEADRAQVVRAAGSIKFRMVVHLFLPEVVDVRSPWVEGAVRGGRVG